ncbi:hypothetical protein OIU76_028939 [Salix suchowensis]|nr:hypothetical protein OIU76_028939 [Salix suchowensis]
MSSHRLLILCLILCVQNYSCNEGSLVTAVRRSNDLRGSENAETTNLRSWNGQTALHRRLHLGNTHGVLNIIGWGTLLPIGAIVARSFRKSPLKCDEWYNLHVVCQTLGYIIGSVGWSIGMWLGNSSKQYSFESTQDSWHHYFHIFNCTDVCSLLATKERKRKKEMVEDMP